VLLKDQAERSPESKPSAKIVSELPDAVVAVGVEIGGALAVAVAVGNGEGVAVGVVVGEAAGAWVRVGDGSGVGVLVAVGVESGKVIEPLIASTSFAASPHRLPTKEREVE
jgi:hypothetical protein